MTRERKKKLKTSRYMKKYYKEHPDYAEKTRQRALARYYRLKAEKQNA